MTKSDLIRDNAVVISSTTPSAKYSWAASQTVLKQLPPGITPPYVLSNNASTVPILQLALSSSELSQMKLFDSGQNVIRPQLAAVAGAAIPSPEGRKILQAQVDLDQHAMQANNVSADDVLNAISVQNLILPAEDQKIGKFDWNVALNASPILLDKINDLAVKKVNGTIIYVHDVAYVHEGIVAANQHGPRQRHQGRADGDPQGRLRLDPRSQSRRLYAVHFAAKEAQ